jgi:hypothetical protein
MTHTMTLRLEDDVYEQIRQEAFDRRLSITAVIRERLSPGLREACARFEAARDA